MSVPLLEAKAVTSIFSSGNTRIVKALDDVNLPIQSGHSVGVMGESGSGKTTLGRCLLRLCKPTHGQIFWKGIDVTDASQRALCKRRTSFQMIFQDADAAFNPRMSLREILTEPQKLHAAGRVSAERTQFIVEKMEQVGLDPKLIDHFPHQLSGGEKQRLAIARALSVNPELLVADEPFRSLDSRVQHQMIELLLSLKKSQNLTYLLISHEPRSIQALCERMVVMHDGQIIEEGETTSLINNALHPQTQLLLRSAGMWDTPK